MSGGELEKYLGEVTFTEAVVGYLRRADKICLGVRKKVSLGLGENLIAGIGGKVGDIPGMEGETMEEAMDREMVEEVGVKIVAKRRLGRARFMFAHKPRDSKWNQSVTIYEITKWKEIPIETESTMPIWFDIDQIPWGRMWEDNRHWLPKVLAGQLVEAVFLFSGDNEISEYRFDEVRTKTD